MHAPLLETGRDVEQAVPTDLIAAWRCTAAVMTYPATIAAGMSAVVLLISSGCVLLDSWSLEGAMSNLFLGFLAAASIAALWISILCPHPVIARNPYRFVTVTTGLLTGLILNSLILKARLQNDSTPAFAVDLFQSWMFSGPLLAGCINLALLIHARNRINEPGVLAPVWASGVPRPHLRLEPALMPVVLDPYRPPVSTRSDPRDWQLP